LAGGDQKRMSMELTLNTPFGAMSCQHKGTTLPRGHGTGKLAEQLELPSRKHMGQANRAETEKSSLFVQADQASRQK
jgi:hypothetical protein